LFWPECVGGEVGHRQHAESAFGSPQALHERSEERERDPRERP
jgi:hypothetical protein